MMRNPTHCVLALLALLATSFRANADQVSANLSGVNDDRAQPIAVGGDSRNAAQVVHVGYLVRVGDDDEPHIVERTPARLPTKQSDHAAAADRLSWVRNVGEFVFRFLHPVGFESRWLRTGEKG